MNWQERFFIRKRATLEIDKIEITFGMFGLYGRLDANFNGVEAARNSRRLDAGDHVYIGNYEVWKDLNYYAAD